MNKESLPDSSIIVLANVAKDQIAKEIIRVNDDYFGKKILIDLVNGQRDYPLVTDTDTIKGFMKIKFAELNTDNTSTGWKRMTRADLEYNQHTTDESTILSKYAAQNPQYLLFGNTITILTGFAPVASTGGIRLWAIFNPTDIEVDQFDEDIIDRDISDSPVDGGIGIPTQFHELMARKVIIDYKESQSTPIKLTEREQNFLFDLINTANNIERVADDQFQASVPPDDGSNY